MSANKKFFLKLTLFLAPLLLWQIIELFILPLDFFAFRPWDVLVVRRLPWQVVGTFLPNQHLVKESTGYCDYTTHKPNPKKKIVEWYTDSSGSRNRPRKKIPERYEIVTHGDSNMGGSFLTQSDTLAEVLEQKCGKPVYNASNAKIILNDDRFLRNPPRFLVTNVNLDANPQTLLVWRFMLDGFYVRHRPCFLPSLLLIYAERFLKQPAREYFRARLNLTQSMSQAGGIKGRRDIDKKLASMTKEQAFDELEKRAVKVVGTYRKLGTEVIYLFMPEARYSIYEQFITNLRQHGILVVDFPPTQEFPNGFPDDYWQTADTHWTEKAVRETADKILEVIHQYDAAQASQ